MITLKKTAIPVVLFLFVCSLVVLKADPPGVGWTLTFSDEFNGQSTYDHAKWTASLGVPSGGSAYNVDSPINIDLSSGTSLKLIAVANNPATGYTYSTGELTTSTLFNQAFGYFECYAKVPAGKGVWPAFWHVEGLAEGGGRYWPPEIDTFEYIGAKSTGTANTAYLTNHWSDKYPLDDNNYHDNGLQCTYVSSQDLSQGFHKYAVDWEPDSITWYIDDIPRYTATSNVPYVRAMDVQLDLEIGSSTSWPGAPDANTIFPSVYEIDYVHVYSRPLPSPWHSTDVGSPANPGRTYASNTGLMNVMGCGAGIGGTSDQFQFAYMPLTGDGTIIARVKNEVPVNSFSATPNTGALAGVMIRNSLTGNDTYALMALEPVVNGTAGGNVYSARTTLSGTATKTVLGNGRTVPSWIKLVRSGSTFTGYNSTDGLTWTSSGTTTITMGSSVYVGLAVTATTATNRATAQFDNISITGSGAQTLASIVVSPQSAAMEPGSDQQFSAIAYDQYGNPMAAQPTFTWTTSGGGTIGSTGIYSAGSTPGGPFTITATSGSIYGVAGVSVRNVPNAPLSLTGVGSTMLSGRVTLNWTNNSTIASGFTVQQQNGAIWSNVGTVSGTTTTFTHTGLAMPSGPHVYRVMANGTGGLDSTYSNSTSVTLPTPPAGPTGLSATPGLNKITLAWNAVSGASNYNVYRATVVSGPYTAIKYNTASNSYIDTTASADTTYFYEVSWNASAGGSLNSAPISATSFGALTTITVSPSNPTVASGSTQQYTAVGTDAGGVSVIPQPTFTWASNGGTIDSSGLFTGTATGTFVITATSGSLNGTATVTVTAGPLATITVTPANPSVLSGGTQQFTAAGTDANGNSVTATYTWSTTGGGTIDSTGLFTATAAGGPYTVTATSGSVNGTASVTVTTPALVLFNDSPQNGCAFYGGAVSASSPVHSGTASYGGAGSAYAQRGITGGTSAVPVGQTTLQEYVYIASPATSVSSFMVQLGAPSYQQVAFSATNSTLWTIDGTAGHTTGLTTNTWHLVRLNLAAAFGSNLVPGTTKISNITTQYTSAAESVYMDDVTLQP